MATTRGKSASAELILLPSLKNCLLNLPSSLVSVLLTANTVAQNVVIELSYRQTTASELDTKRQQQPHAPKSIFAGWTGMQSQTKAGSLVSREGASKSAREEAAKDVQTVEMDATFGRILGLSTGMRVDVKLHIDPPQAHTVNVEPLTATDWEIIELHARFLEMNFLSQVRALPNPAAPGGQSHPLTLHLTPTSTANIAIKSLVPAAASSQPFVKISPDAEVIVAPKTRQSQRTSGTRDSRSVTSRQSAGGRSTRSVRHKDGRYDEERARPPLFLRAITRALENGDLFDPDDENLKDDKLKLWLDREHLLSSTLRGVSWVAVTLIRPAGLQEPVSPQQQGAQEQLPAQQVVAKLCSWDDAPNSTHAVLSTLLCSAFGADGLVGGIVRIEPAPNPLPRTASAMKEPSQHASKDAIIKKLRVTPFIPNVNEKTTSKQQAGFRFGGESKTQQEESAQKLRSIFGKTLLEGPLTDGMLLPALQGWPGGILDFDPAPPGDASKPRLNWLLGEGRKFEIAVRSETARPRVSTGVGEILPEQPPEMVGIDSIVEKLRSSLMHGSSVLLTGGLGAGKTALTQLLGHQLRREYLYHVVYFPCRSLTNDETRVKAIKETMHRLFASAAWAARLGGRSLVVLDDIDKLCPVEQELQMDANGRSKQVSELLCNLVRQYCGRDSRVVLVATAQSKEAVNNVVVGGHVVRDIVALKAPDKEGRRKVLEKLVRDAAVKSSPRHQQNRLPVGEGQESDSAKNEWMEGSDDGIEDGKSEANGRAQDQDEDAVEIDADLDLLHIAGETDGYMPGDLALLVSRARSEALIRAITDQAISDKVTLAAVDFTAALKGFTPAGLRGVTLQHSSTTFAAIGGLKQTRQTLLETLQYPTIYAPLFAKCPLRLRSGLLLYGYPGCGKTLLASAVAGECGLNFISVKGPEILNKYIGASEKSVRDLFERAEAAKPCVLFFDEFDSIAPKRGHDSTGVTDRVVNMLLTMMDGAEGLSGVYVLAATSRPDLIDPALLRPGRLDKSLECGMPDPDDRLEILRAVGGKLKLDQALVAGKGNESLVEVARRTDGYSGADLQAVVYNAHLEAIHDLLGSGAASAAQDDFDKRKDGKAGVGRSTSGFTYFRLGEGEQHRSDSPPSAANLAQHAAERAQIATKLAALQVARRKAKEVAKQQTPTNGRVPDSMRQNGAHMNGTGSRGNENGSSAEPVILWKHLAKSLQETRSSISKQERGRLERIYREFVVGRSGEMQDGSGSVEVGGRSSLM